MRQENKLSEQGGEYACQRGKEITELASQMIGGEPMGEQEQGERTASECAPPGRKKKSKGRGGNHPKVRKVLPKLA